MVSVVSVVWVVSVVSVVWVVWVVILFSYLLKTTEHRVAKPGVHTAGSHLIYYTT